MRNNINWNTENVAMPALDFEAVNNWIVAVAASHSRIVGDLTYIFCDDERILEVNRRFLNHDYYTDIITFDYSTGRLVSGDMFISLDTVKSNAVGLGQVYARELLRVIVHGVLHLCGINDKGPGEREIMEANEDKALAMLPPALLASVAAGPI
ncbi:MAG: rRNA maturation RNase YbeY [Muribaculaceae bacterium]